MSLIDKKKTKGKRKSDVRVFEVIKNKVEEHPFATGAIIGAIPFVGVAVGLGALVICLKEIITQKKLLEIMAAKCIKKCIIGSVNRVKNTVSLQDMGTTITVQGTGIADDVQKGKMIYA